MHWLPYVAYAAGAFLCLQITFLVYGAAAAMIGRGKIPWFWWLPIGLCFVVGLVLDLAFNLGPGWLMFARSPLPLLRDWILRLAYLPGRFLGMRKPNDRLTFSERVEHEYQTADGWRWKLAAWWRSTLNAPVPFHIA